jgi:hypothetical protein
VFTELLPGNAYSKSVIIYDVNRSTVLNITIDNRTYVYMKFLGGDDLRYELLELRHEVLHHPGYMADVVDRTSNNSKATSLLNTAVTSRVNVTQISRPTRTARLGIALQHINVQLEFEMKPVLSRSLHEESS